MSTTRITSPSIEETVVVQIGGRLMSLTYDQTQVRDGFYPVKKLKPVPKKPASVLLTETANKISAEAASKMFKENAIVQLIKAGKEEEIDEIIKLLNEYFEFKYPDGFELYFGASDSDYQIDLRMFYSIHDKMKIEQKIKNLFTSCYAQNSHGQTMENVQFILDQRDFDGSRKALIIKSINKDQLKNFISEIAQLQQQAYVPPSNEIVSLLREHLPLPDEVKSSLHINESTGDIESDFFCKSALMCKFNPSGAQFLYRGNAEAKEITFKSNSYERLDSVNVLKYQLIIKINDLNLLIKDLNGLKNPPNTTPLPPPINQTAPSKDLGPEEMKYLVEAISGSPYFSSLTKEAIENKLRFATYGSFFIRLSTDKKDIVVTIKTRTSIGTWGETGKESYIAHRAFGKKDLIKCLTEPQKLINEAIRISQQDMDDFDKDFEKQKIEYLKVVRRDFTFSDQAISALNVLAKNHGVPYDYAIECILYIVNYFKPPGTDAASFCADAASLFNSLYEQVKSDLMILGGEFYATQILNNYAHLWLPTLLIKNESNNEYGINYAIFYRRLLEEAKKEGDMRKVLFFIRLHPGLIAISHVYLNEALQQKIADENLVKEFLKLDQFDINGLDRQNNTFFHLACAHFHSVELFQSLMARQPRLDIRDNMGRTALDIILINNNQAALNVLMQHYDKKFLASCISLPLLKSEVTMKKYQNTPLHIACANDMDYIVEILLLRGDEIDWNAENRNGNTPLTLAYINGNERIINLLLAREGIQDLKAPKLYYACRYNHLKMVIYLLRQETTESAIEKINKIPLNHSYTPLHLVCNTVETAKLLLGYKGIDINKKDWEGNTALHTACAAGNLEIVKLLLNYGGADLHATNKEGKTPLHLVCGREKGYYKDDIIDPEIIAELLAADPTTLHDLTPHKQTLLHLACKNTNLGTVKLLLKQKEININLQDHDGMTPLHLACLRKNGIGFAGIVETLLKEEKIDITVKNASGRLPIEMANGIDRMDRDHVKKLFKEKKQRDAAKVTFNNPLVLFPVPKGDASTPPGIVVNHLNIRY